MKYSIELSNLLILSMPKYIHYTDGLRLNGVTLKFVPVTVTCMTYRAHWYLPRENGRANRVGLLLTLLKDLFLS